MGRGLRGILDAALYGDSVKYRMYSGSDMQGTTLTNPANEAQKIKNK